MAIYNRYSLAIKAIFIICVSFFGIGDIVYASSVLDTNDPFAKQWAFEDIGVYTAWNISPKSSNVVVALIDNGFDMFHPDLRQNVWRNVNEIPGNNKDDDNNGYVDDVWGWSFIPVDQDKNGVIDEIEALGTNDPRPTVVGADAYALASDTIHHGTIVAGLVGAVGNNGKGISGVAPHVLLMNIQLVDETGIGSFKLFDKAIRYAVDNGADIINISMVGEFYDFLNNSIAYAYDNGVVVVAAAGNTALDLNATPLYPVCADKGSLVQHVLGVSSVSKDRRLSFFSNIGSGCVDITAPGEGITSTVRYSPKNGLVDLYRGGWSGTSFATPLVSGAAALIKTIQPHWGPDDIYKAILSTVHHTLGQDEHMYANMFGAGLLQVDKAVRYALDRIVSKRIFSSILFLSPKDGRIQEGVKNNTKSAEINSQLQSIDDVVVYTAGKETRYVTSKRAGEKERAITIYSSVWEKISSFSVPASGPLGLAVADVTGDKELELIVFPTYSNKQVFSIYTLSGKLKHQYNTGFTHTGVSLVVTKEGKILTFTEQNEKPVVDIFYTAFKAPVSSIAISSLQRRGSITAGDVDGDRQDEIIIGGAVGERPVVSIYEIDGTLKRTFFVYDGYQGGFSLESADYDHDGKDDILIIPRQNIELARVWNEKSKKLTEWGMFKGHSLSDIITFIKN